MRPTKPSRFCMKKIDELLVDTKNGRVWRGDDEIANRYPRGRNIISMRDENGNVKHFKRYHVVWYFKTGRWPRLELHHKDENPGNDAFTNLEECTHEVNCLHSKRSKLPIGVDKQGRKYRSRVGQKVIGRFATVEEAVAARRSARL